MNLSDRTNIAALLRSAAEGRREYAKNAPERSAELLHAEAATLDAAARVVEGDLRPMYGWLPSRLWTDDMIAAMRDEERS